MCIFANVWIAEEKKDKVRKEQSSYGVDDADAV